jgi:glycosyltransferase involved in cell wall biosynthesis
MKTRTLFITIDMPYDGGSGGQIVSWRALEAPAEHAFIDLLVLAPADAEPSAQLLKLVDRCAVVDVGAFYFSRANGPLLRTFARSQVCRTPYRILKFAKKEMANLVARRSVEYHYDVVHADHLSTWQYARRVNARRRILLDHNVESQMFETLAHRRRPPTSWALLREARRVARYEQRAVAESDLTLVLSAQDRDLLSARIDSPEASRVDVWPVAVPRRSLEPGPASRRFLHLGSLRSAARREGLRWLLREVWPAVRDLAPDARLDIVGADPPSEALALDGSHGIAVHGYLDDIDAILTETEACLIPIFAGAGVRVKILEMLSRGIPCIGTPLGVQGTEDLPGVFAASAATEWLELVRLAIDDPRRMRRAASLAQQRLNETRTTARAVAYLRENVYA